VTTPIRGQFVTPMPVRHMANQCTKFDKWRYFASKIGCHGNVHLSIPKCMQYLSSPSIALPTWGKHAGGIKKTLERVYLNDNKFRLTQMVPRDVLRHVKRPSHCITKLDVGRAGIGCQTKKLESNNQNAAQCVVNQISRQLNRFNIIRRLFQPSYCKKRYQ